MPRLLFALGALATTSGVVAGVSTPPARHVAIVGEKQPVFLGSVTVTASALPR